MRSARMPTLSGLCGSHFSPTNAAGNSSESAAIAAFAASRRARRALRNLDSGVDGDWAMPWVSPQMTLSDSGPAVVRSPAPAPLLWRNYASADAIARSDTARDDGSTGFGAAD